ncbi:MAG: M1 family metallopeptidase [Flavobacteriales bacterium]|nr:M1 family metallopeptidase [Flavobacteriales bacterium]
MKKVLLLALVIATTQLLAQENYNYNKFKQLKEELATPTVYRTASGAPGHKYYQQKANYVIDLTLDDKTQKITGKETITYKNNSPDQLDYLWLQLDQNMRAKDSDSKLVNSINMGEEKSFAEIARLHNDFDGGFKLDYVKSGSGKDLKYTINKTMMRIDLPTPLAAGATTSIKIGWWYNINNRDEIGGRSGYEYFKEDDNYLYTIAQFYPRMAVYNETEGWQNKQFLGNGEFTLTFGDFKVNITVPADHIVGATGSLTNPSSVLTSEQRSRFKKAQSEYLKPVIIVTQAEAEEKEKTKASGTKTWSFSATNVRDFAFASSRKFIWDAMAVKYNGNSTIAMSYYPKEGNPLWEQYSTRVVAHTIASYSKHTCDYPYPVAISVHSKSIGMEYPMICFNGGRPNKDGTYSKRTKYAMIGVIIHEVGHNFFPMIINSDERQWTWMDEGLNTFTQYLCEQEWEKGYPSRRGPAYKIVDYMKGDKKNITPIMTNSESLHQFGNNAYGKPAAALNILRETVMGRELFDFAFKTYAERWKLKHPTPADFFRTMEDASGVDLDWFWRGWFYTTDHCDIAIENVEWFKIVTKNPEVEKAIAKELKDAEAVHIGVTRNEKMEVYSDKDPKILDFYNQYDPFKVTLVDKEEHEKYIAKLSENDIKILESDFNYYNIDFVNKGGLVMPILLNFTFKDGSTKEVRIPAEIWRKNDKQVSKVFFFKKEVVNIDMDPWLETADINLDDNSWPRRVQLSKFKLYQKKKYGWGVDGKENTMQRDRRNEELKNEKK